MGKKISFIIDGVSVEGQEGETILEAANNAGIYVPHLCFLKGLTAFGSCRVCTVIVNGRPQAACTQPIAANMIVENDTDKVNALRRDIVDMLFVEGNHFCMFCEKSGECELQALAYRLGITAPKYPFMFPQREVDASHSDVFIDRNRCVLCGRCVTASKTLDKKNVFQFVGRGIDKRIAVNSESKLSETDLDIADKAADVCPVGSIIKKRTGFKTPVGERKYDKKPISLENEKSLDCTKE